jgi:hypothetical protein
MRCAWAMTSLAQTAGLIVPTASVDLFSVFEFWSFGIVWDFDIRTSGLYRFDAIGIGIGVGIAIDAQSVREAGK